MKKGKMEGLAEFLAGVADLMKTEGVIFEDLLAADIPERVQVNFHTWVHEYSLSLDYTLGQEGNVLGVCVWHGSGCHDIAEGPLNAATWEAIKAAIRKTDEECDYQHGQLS